jgi:hypothetical protein
MIVDHGFVVKLPRDVYSIEPVTLPDGEDGGSLPTFDQSKQKIIAYLQNEIDYWTYQTEEGYFLEPNQVTVSKE